MNCICCGKDTPVRLCPNCREEGAVWAAMEARAEANRRALLARQHEVIQELLVMRQEHASKFYFGPWIVVVPKEREAEIMADYAVKHPTQTLQDRILSIEGFTKMEFMAGSPMCLKIA